MSRSTDDLIRTLSTELKPSGRLAPPMLRSLIWLGVVLALIAATALLFARFGGLVTRMDQPRFALEVFATLATGVTGVIAAFHLALPDRSRRWALLPLPAALLWLATSGFGCWSSWATRGPNGLGLGETTQCFAFIVGASIPIGGLLLLALSRARPLQPGAVAAIGGLGAAGLAAFALEFIHPAQTTLIDLGYHLVAVAVVTAAATALGRTAMVRG
jgi:hypothetical protein